MPLLFILVLGLLIGSFLGAYTYRYPKDIPISKGRSKCPSCKHVIAWYDNIPLVSFILLGGKCRNCKKPISVQYALIESSTAVVFILTTLLYPWIVQNIGWIGSLGIFGLPLVLFFVTLLLAVFYIDFLHQLIPDSVVFIGIITTLVVFALGTESFYLNLLSGLLAGSFLLMIHIVTAGRGMGLGDVKLALFIGLVLGANLTVIWMLLAFILGATAGIILLLFKKVKLKERIAFGPFLVVSFFVVAVWGKMLSLLLLPL
ncbi:hypothetical protein A2801_02830 [Candidatus Woesebacteria bacterium RIFCSPHIGHO2_01_FULL_41_10]|uniref:Prepilin peptidase n=1 Tax=Candidatus Woesebacteria bacterium RIFCSPHIGHO2_01_FULL_41_10 TaxID=1802500 RepID=A0A1F7YNF3_9BACT|nr:MAG: hypothetical protein A2801_02830 [Candidatus Woesebacteria bacterium RIFCSPHIGHO2_01_FULL_41_10]